MKATINGITVEGTPSEIHEYSKLVQDSTNKRLWEGLKIPSGPHITINHDNTVGQCAEGPPYAITTGTIDTNEIAGHSLTAEKLGNPSFSHDSPYISGYITHESADTITRGVITAEPIGKCSEYGAPLPLEKKFYGDDEPEETEDIRAYEGDTQL